MMYKLIEYVFSILINVGIVVSWVLAIHGTYTTHGWWNLAWIVLSLWVLTVFKVMENTANRMGSRGGQE